MKRLCSLFIISAVLLSLAACSAQPSQSSPPPPAENTDDSPGQTASPPPETPAPQETAEPTPEPENWEALFTEYLEQNYDSLNNYAMATGVGFIDLDLDGYPELLLFDAGASAAMGVHIFDIIDGQVCCASTNEYVGEKFACEHTSFLNIYANYFEDFRLMVDTSSGEKFFLVRSGNGNTEFFYEELIRFDKSEAVLRPVSLLYASKSYDEDGNLSSATYRQGETPIDQAEYDRLYAELFEGIADTGYEAKGVFIWNDSANYSYTYDGFMAMLRDALAAYEPAV
ncbi:MAG: hypothetical protein ACOX7I_06775 [Oscillospiraceae bacterium]|jgi:hypothetical protein